MRIVDKNKTEIMSPIRLKKGKNGTDVVLGNIEREQGMWRLQCPVRAENYISRSRVEGYTATREKVKQRR
jgi:hypothetical protein